MERQGSFLLRSMQSRTWNSVNNVTLLFILKGSGSGSGTLMHAMAYSSLKPTKKCLYWVKIYTCNVPDKIPYIYPYVCFVVVQYWCGRHHERGLEWVEGAFPVQPCHQPAGDYPLLEAQHGKRRRRGWPTEDMTVSHLHSSISVK